jgi:CheY-like chemotaxis protein
MSEKFSILLAEDNPDDRQIFKVALKRADGLDVAEVRNGEEVINYLKGKDGFSDRARFPLPNLLLLDLVMPHMSGLDVLKWLRAQSKFTDLPVIVWSGSDIPGQAAAVGVFDAEYIPKANDFDGTVQLARRIVQKALKMSHGNGSASRQKTRFLD